MFFEAQARKSAGMVIFELVGTIAGLAAFALSFLLFEWWWPLVALAVGFWVVAPILVNRNSFAFFYQTKALTGLVSLICSLAICGFYFELI